MVTYLVTGTNRGIGLQLVKELAATSEDFIFATVRTADKLKVIEGLGFPNVKPLVLDISGTLESFEESLKVINEVKPEGIDVVINNAGICPEKNLEHSSTQDINTYAELYKVNTIGTVKLYRAVKPYLFKSPSPHKKFVAISSIAGSIGDMAKGFDAYGFNGYGMSKAAVNYFIKQISREHAGDSNDIIRSCIALAVAPGTVKTDMTVEYRENGRFKDEDLLTVEQSAQGVLNVVKNADSAQNGAFLNYDGSSFNF